MGTNDHSSTRIAEFWDKNPCGEEFIPAADGAEFFRQADLIKQREPHIAENLRKFDFRDKRVLEIGLGQGCEAQKIIEAGGIYTGIDITAESVQRVKTRCRLFSLPYESVRIMNAEQMDFADQSFDVVFTHGVIHHSPRIGQIIREIHRVLRDRGKVIAMVYHRNSLNYHFSIRVVRRTGIFLLGIPGAARIIGWATGEKQDRLEKHLANLKHEGLRYLKLENFIHRATDGPDNVFSSVFSKQELGYLFREFHDLSFSVHYLNERHFPVLRSLLPAKVKEKLAARFGWHIWVAGTK
jgi:SAM-dependent methyltransferase